MINRFKQWFGWGDSSEATIDVLHDDLQLRAYYNQRHQKPQRTFCHAPSVNMYFDRRGYVVACCHNRSYLLGTYPNMGIKEIWQGEKAERLREAMRKNDLSLGCLVCQNDLRRASYPEIKANHFDHIERNPDYPTMMEFELDSTCNLECVMCSGEFSSSIRKNREQLPPIPSPYDEAFAEQLKEFIPHLHEARFSGGEPFLVQLYFPIWEEIVRVNPNCLISVQTNGTVLNNRVRDIMEKGRFEIGVSLDSITAKTFETIRKNAKFDRVMEHIEYFYEYCQRKQTPFRLAMCVMRNNWQEMPEYIRMCNGYNAYASFHQVYNPADSSIFKLPAPELQEMHAWLSKHDFPADNHVQQRNKEHYQNFLKTLLQAASQAEGGETYTKDSLSEENIAALLQDYVNDARQFINGNEILLPEERKDKIAQCERTLRLIFEHSREKEVLHEVLNKIELMPMEQLIHFLTMEEERLTDLINKLAAGEFG